jgi:hypothetical protein
MNKDPMADSAKQQPDGTRSDTKPLGPATAELIRQLARRAAREYADMTTDRATPCPP